MSFDVDGATNRRTGRFVMMTAQDSPPDTPFAKVFIGEWFTTKVTHVFAIDQNSYFNTVLCTKLHSSSNLDRQEFTDMYSRHYDAQLDFWKSTTGTRDAIA